MKFIATQHEHLSSCPAKRAHPSPFLKGGGRPPERAAQRRAGGGESAQRALRIRECRTPHPVAPPTRRADPPPQPKSDVSDFRRFDLPNSGTPEFGGRVKNKAFSRRFSSSCPAKRGRGTTPKGWWKGRPLHHAAHGPPPPLRFTSQGRMPSRPRSRRGNRDRRSRWE